MDGDRFNYEDYVKQYGPYIDRVGCLRGPIFAVMFDGVCDSFESRSIPPHMRKAPHYQFKLVRLPEGYYVTTGIMVPWFGFEGGGTTVHIINGATGQKVSALELLHKNIIELRTQEEIDAHV